MKQIKKLTVLALLGIVSAAALASGMDQASAVELRGHQPAHRQVLQVEESESGSESEDSDEEDEHALVQQAAQHQIGRWTAMDSAITAAEDEIVLANGAMDEKRAKGELTTLSGFNDEDDEMVTPYHEPGDPAQDDDFLHKVFHRHYTRDGKEHEGNKVLTHSNAWLASKEVVQKWNKFDSAEADEYLNHNFERVWQHYDVNNEGKIRVDSAYNFEKSLVGSFSITYSEQ